jgi:hypothetical protein
VAPLLFTALVGLVLGCGGFGLVVKNLDQEIGEVGAGSDRSSADFDNATAGLSRA